MKWLENGLLPLVPQVAKTLFLATVASCDVIFGSPGFSTSSPSDVKYLK